MRGTGNVLPLPTAPGVRPGAVRGVESAGDVVPRGDRAATPAVEVVLLPGRPEGLEVVATCPGVSDAGHAPIEPDLVPFV
jgi:hypothetical protein